MNGKSLINNALSASQCIISVIGEHAGEGIHGILKRKIDDIKEVGLTFWLQKSSKAKPPLVHKLCASGQTYTFLIEPSSKGGAQPTKSNHKATEYSKDGITWRSISQDYPRLGPVTGNVSKSAPAYALVFDKLEIIQDISHPPLDLWSYADYENPQERIRPYPGRSDICAVKKDMSNHPKRLRPEFTTSPYCCGGASCRTI